MTPLLLALVVVTGLFTLRKGVSSVHIALLITLPATYGLVLFRNSGAVSGRVVPLYVAGLLCLVAGLSASRLSNGPARQSAGVGADTRRIRCKGLVGVVLIGTVYHFVVGGIPILSPNAEVARFDVTASGLFGVPGRIVLFGIPVALAMVVARARALGSPITKDPYVLTVGTVYILSRLLLGFKSGLIEAATTSAILIIVSPRGLQIPRALRLTVLWGIPAIVFAYVTASTYSTYAQTSLVASLWARATRLSASPVAVLLDTHAEIAGGGRNLFLNDLIYFLAKYLHLVPATSLSSSQLIAAQTLGLPPTTQIPLPPVTTGLFPYLFYMLGSVAFVIIFIVGLVIGRLEHICQSRGGGWLVGILTSVVLALQDAVTKGNPVYVILNWGLAIIVMGAVSVTAPEKKFRCVSTGCNDAPLSPSQKLALEGSV